MRTLNNDAIGLVDKLGKSSSLQISVHLVDVTEEV